MLYMAPSAGLAPVSRRVPGSSEDTLVAVRSGMWESVIWDRQLSVPLAARAFQPVCLRTLETVILGMPGFPMLDTERLPDWLPG